VQVRVRNVREVVGVCYGSVVSVCCNCVCAKVCVCARAHVFYTHKHR
jgi:hypothetical protein